MFLRVGHGGRGADKARIAAVEAAQPLQTAQHVGHVAAEDAAVDVDFVHDDELQPAEERPPRRVVGQDAGVEHVGVGDEDAAGGAHGRALAARRVAVVGVDGHGQPGGGDERGRLRLLVVGQGLGREEVEGAGVGLLQQPLQHRQGVGQRLAAGCGRADDDVLAAPGGFDGRGLVAVERRHAPPAQRRGDAWVEPLRQRSRARRPRRNALPGDDVGDEVAVEAEVVEDGGEHGYLQAADIRLFNLPVL